MSIKVLYFASLQDRVGRQADEFAWDGPISAGALWRRLNPDLAWPDNMLIAINMDYAASDTALSDGDEVAFFPPVTGG